MAEETTEETRDEAFAQGARIHAALAIYAARLRSKGAAPKAIADAFLTVAVDIALSVMPRRNAAQWLEDAAFAIREETEVAPG